MKQELITFSEIVIPEPINSVYTMDWFSAEKSSMEAISWLSTFVSNVNNWLIGGIRGWVNNLTWSSSAYNSVTYSSGTLTLSNGFSYSITGDTVTLTTVTYIYLDTAISITALQTTTTASDSVWGTKILVCVASPTVSGKDAQFQVFWGAGSEIFITADNIAANSITTNEIAANTITANNLSTALLYAGSITLDTNWNIKSGKTAFTDDTNSWFWLWDVSWAKKFKIGSSSSYMAYDSSLSVIGGTITGGTIQTGTSWQRVVMSGSVIESYDSSWLSRWKTNGSWFRLVDSTNSRNTDVTWWAAIGSLATMDIDGWLFVKAISWKAWVWCNIYTYWGQITFQWYWWAWSWITLSSTTDNTLVLSWDTITLAGKNLYSNWTDLYWNGVKIN